MPAISIGTVEVDVIPNAQGIRQRMRAQILPAANSVGDEVGRVLGRYLTQHVSDAVRDGLRQGAATATPQATRAGSNAGGAFGRAFQSRVRAAMHDLPRANVRISDTGFNADMDRLRARLETLSNKRIGVDVDSATALAEVRRLERDLQRLGAQHPDVQVRIDTGRAIAQLQTLRAEIRQLDGREIDLKINTRGVAGELLALSAITIGPGILPALPVIAAGLGAIAASATAAAAGLGAIGLVAVPAFRQITSVLQAQKAAQDAATNATYQGGQAARQAASRALQMAGAQQALATAERNGARQIAQAQQQVRQAKQAAADAIAQAALRNKEAARRVEDAERSLVDAQRDARRAQEDLNDARREAARDLEDLNRKLAGAHLDQRQAVLDLQDAERELRAVRAKGSAATAAELQRALLNYDRAKQNLADQTVETKRLEEETKAANKAGVEGSKTVVSAQERLAEAQRRVADQQRAVREAQEAAARTQVETARQVAEAQRRVGEATANVAVAQQNAADAVASAQRQIESASLSAAGGVDQAAIAQAKYREELAKLTPAARETMEAYLGLRDAFSQWSKSLQPAVMPLFTRALLALKAALPGLTPFALQAADAVQSLMDRASAEVKTPFWQEFRGDLEASVKPAIEGLGVAFGNVFKGIAGVIGAFLPHMDSISERMQDVTQGFADWGTSLKGSPEFEDFLSYSGEMAPKLWEALKSIATAALDVAQALQPFSSAALSIVTGLADGISWVATNAPFAIQMIYGIVAAMYAWRLGVAAWSAAQRVATLAMAAFNLVSMAGPWGWIALAIAGVVAAVILLWNKCDWFRAAVIAVWDAIKKGVQAVIDWFKGPFTEFFTKTIPAVFWSVLGWVKNNWPWILGALTGPIGLAVAAIIKYWDRIKAAFRNAWDWIKKSVLYPIRDFFTKTIPGWGTTLKDRMVGAFDEARKGIKNAWDRIKKIAREPVQYVVDVVYNDGIRAVWNKIAKAFGAKQLERYKFASGGVMPGYTPGRDVHKFVSPTGGMLELSGGEAIMRPEFTRAVGSGFVHTLNRIASTRGAQGVKAALAPALGGNPATPTDRSLRYAHGGVVQSFADGGIFGWIKKAGAKAVGAGSSIWNSVKEGAKWLKDSLYGSAKAGVKNVVDPLLKRFPGADTGFGRMVRKIPDKIIDALFGYTKEADKRGAGGIGGPRIQAALKWAKTQHGKPYQWGGNGNPSWDCSGFMSAIESVIRGEKPHRRWSTHAFKGGAPPGWVRNGDSAFRVGITHAGVGHTAGTLGKTNVESRGGDGVVVGKRARGYNDRLFTSWYGFKPGSYDSGGYLQPGLNLAYNGTGRPEPVFTTSQANALLAAAKANAAGLRPGDQLRLVVDGREFSAYIDGRADLRVSARQQQIMQAIGAS